MFKRPKFDSIDICTNCKLIEHCNDITCNSFQLLNELGYIYEEEEDDEE